MTTNEGDKQIKNILAQYPERYHKLRKAIARKKESIGRSHEADGHTKASKGNEVLLKYGTKPSSTTG